MKTGGASNENSDRPGAAVSGHIHCLDRGDRCACVSCISGIEVNLEDGDVTMSFLIQHILSLILFLPAIAAVILLFLPANETRLLKWFAFLASLFPFALTILLWSGFQTGTAGFQFEENYSSGLQPINSSFHLGVDGISLTMVLLTTLLTPLALLASFSIQDRIKPYLILFLLLETGMLGVFLSLDLLLFFLFWEIGLVPMYFLINQWGGENRNYASLKFILYTMAGSLGLLLSIQLIGVITGTFDLVQIMERWPMLSGDHCWVCRLPPSRH